ncbi:MAG: NDP-sugar pyrophosphorylase family protein [Maribacter sp.]|jgi:NDP-sugar pyrophosphorylase family protein
MSKKAMIFAAGLGTRLRPLTNDRPKAMVEVNGKTLLEINIRKLVSFGFKDIVVNVHHFADLVLDYLDASDFGANIIISDERGELLETGGGLKKASDLLQGEPFLVHNVDILTDLDLNAFYDYHQKNHALATLATRQRETSRYLLFNENKVLHGWTNIKAGIVRQKRATEKDLFFRAFSGIHIISPDIFPLFTREGKFSIIDTYLDCAKEHLIQSYEHDDGLWLDVGKHESLKEAEELF